MVDVEQLLTIQQEHSQTHLLLSLMKYTPCLMISAIKALQIIIKTLQYVTLLQHVLFVIVKVVVKPADLG